MANCENHYMNLNQQVKGKNPFGPNINAVALAALLALGSQGAFAHPDHKSRPLDSVGIADIIKSQGLYNYLNHEASAHHGELPINEIANFTDIIDPEIEKEVLHIIQGIGFKKFLEILKTSGFHRLALFFTYDGKKIGEDTIIGTWRLVKNGADIGKVLSGMGSTIPELMSLKPGQEEIHHRPLKSLKRSYEIYARNIEKAVSSR